MSKLKCNIGEYGVIINKKGEFLILKLPINKEFTKDMWMFPGGRLEKEEQPEIGLKREVLEETGLKIKIIAPLHTARWGIENPAKYSVFYLCKLSGGGPVKISVEHMDSKWVNFSDIEKIQWHNINSKIAAKKAKKYLAT
ncbi:NUDIX hydrolase [Candidatus Falkowbacteria bacterium]|jgi:8-oxo-dGTP diphosphatase|nr:NUDIX hydrolase [Patescibacteria group bacterium]MDD3435130.1 NUDIX hydrolase [Patescibacteria group bacterium]MDD4466414.1 NUDIX hydrolase [Patescibacteria group bacterium]NCU42734.1 NUDIX hydrolase [Candidatus Falkowbacteria bacterium]